jgi:hypothetical protein
MTGFDSKRQMAQDKEALRLALEALESGVKTTANRISWTEYDACLMSDALNAMKEALAQKQEPRNFCSRCGKRTADLTVIHTCTPPEGGFQ